MIEIATQCLCYDLDCTNVFVAMWAIKDFAAEEAFYSLLSTDTHVCMYPYTQPRLAMGVVE